jgi:hypothetical protein
MKRTPQLRRLRAARRREGAVLLIVLLMLMLATGSALYAMQATLYEQGASTAYAQAAWTSALAEGAVMSTLAVVEEDGIPRGALNQNLDRRWQDTSDRAEFSIKYGLPTPLGGMTTPMPDPDTARSVENAVDNAAFLATMPEGLTGFCMLARDGQSPYGALTASYRVGVCRAIYETWGGLGTGTTTTAAGVATPVRPRTRTVITGIGETGIPADPLDPGGQRGLHETVGMARAYFDRLN